VCVQKVQGVRQKREEWGERREERKEGRGERCGGVFEREIGLAMRVMVRGGARFVDEGLDSGDGSAGAAGVAEWTILELQGELDQVGRGEGLGPAEGVPLVASVDEDAPASASGAVGARVGCEASGKTLGTLARHPVDASKVVLTIGYHQLEGGFVDLKKPLVVLRKESGAGKGAGEEAETSDGESAEASEAGHWFEVEAVVRRKLLFNKRPKALISKPGEEKERMRRATEAASAGKLTPAVVFQAKRKQRANIFEIAKTTGAKRVKAVAGDPPADA